jgi:hypothetical protein
MGRVRSLTLPREGICITGMGPIPSGGALYAPAGGVLTIPRRCGPPGAGWRSMVRVPGPPAPQANAGFLHPPRRLDLRTRTPVFRPRAWPLVFCPRAAISMPVGWSRGLARTPQGVFVEQMVRSGRRGGDCRPRPEHRGLRCTHSDRDTVRIPGRGIGLFLAYEVEYNEYHSG